MILLIGILIPLTVLQFKKTEVWFVKFDQGDTVLDHKELLLLEGDATQEVRKALNKFTVGSHVIHRNIHWQKNILMEFDVKRGKNYIVKNWQGNELPALSKDLTLKDKDD